MLNSKCKSLMNQHLYVCQEGLEYGCLNRPLPCCMRNSAVLQERVARETVTAFNDCPWLPDCASADCPGLRHTEKVGSDKPQLRFRPGSCLYRQGLRLAPKLRTRCQPHGWSAREQLVSSRLGQRYWGDMILACSDNVRSHTRQQHGDPSS